MTMRKQTLGARMRVVRSRRRARPLITRVPDRMLESMRQSLRVEGYDISAEEARRAAQHVLDSYRAAA